VIEFSVTHACSEERRRQKGAGVMQGLIDTGIVNCNKRPDACRELAGAIRVEKRVVGKGMEYDGTGCGVAQRYV
jgi:hypothetical protein